MAPHRWASDTHRAAQVSEDTGNTWSNRTFLCQDECQGFVRKQGVGIGVCVCARLHAAPAPQHWQFDPAATIDQDGVLHASWLNNFNLACVAAVCRRRALLLCVQTPTVCHSYARSPTITNDTFSTFYPCLSSAGESITNSTLCIKHPPKGLWADKPWMVRAHEALAPVPLFFLFFAHCVIVRCCC